MGASTSRENEAAALEYIDRVLTDHPVAIFSKSYCPYCHLAKDVMKQAGVPFHVVELDQKHDEPTGSDIQSALATKTGRRTVPNVFLNKESIGGGSDVDALFQSGKLTEMLHAAGVLK
uniref:Glutaredoxin domain-containing protein n=1 Tax=Globisporangium ultimum (strain ATCC 200006 / CBS 805.95 / DAOM BR144) TaxID=431595 RepID=K3XAR2_GLOUD